MKELLQSEENNQWDEKAICKMEENIFKTYIW